MYLLNMRFTHVYLHHRYSLEGLIKNIGGMDFRYAIRGDGQTPTAIIPEAQQLKALDMVMDALEPEALAVPERVMALIPPVPYGGDEALAWMGSAGGTSFDQISLAGGLATEVTKDSCTAAPARVAQFSARTPVADAADVLGAVVARTWGGDGRRSQRAGVAAYGSAWCSIRLDRAGDKQAPRRRGRARSGSCNSSMLGLHR
jgi:hypothetical protein